jgi:tetratricopeptide (TPR) repeat protein
MKSAMVARVRHAWPAIALLGWLAVAAGRSAEASPEVSELARSWDHVNFEIKSPAAQIAAAEALAQQAQAMARSRPGDPAPLIWEAAALLAKADARHDLASLGLARQARRLLEQATAEGASGAQGAFAYAVLGELYGAAPGFPLGFGDRRKARAEFAKAFALAPDDIEVNVLYADFLLDQRDPQGAIDAARRGLNAPPRPGREVGDKGRREEAQSVIAKAEREMRQR